jgi:hypothetical protein
MMKLNKIKLKLELKLRLQFFYNRGSRTHQKRNLWNLSSSLYKSEGLRMPQQLVHKNIENTF